MDIQSLAGPALISFGGVWVINYLLTKFTDIRLETESKLILGGIIVFAWGFIPANLGLDFVNRIRDAIAVTIGLTGFYQGGKGIVLAVKSKGGK